MSLLTTESGAKLKASQARVLVADDDEPMREILKEVLKSFGFQRIAVTNDGDATVMELEFNQFDLIICDWEMPGATGDEILKLVRESENNKNSIFVMCTANSNAESVKQAILAGVSYYIVKPLDPDTMAEKLKAHVQLHC